MLGRFSQIIWQVNALGYGLVLASLFGVILWWLIRRKRERIWFPILQIVEHSKRQLPTLKLKAPPWWAFFCYLCLASLLVFLSGEPKQRQLKPRIQKYNREHIFVDLSPSVSAHMSMAEYRRFITSLYNRVSSDQQTKVSLSFSNSDSIYTIADPTELANLLGEADYHRFGAQLGESLEVQLKNLSEIDQMFILSDADAFSWEGFNWRFLEDKMDLSFVDVRPKVLQQDNIYINYARLATSIGAKTYEWNIEIARRHADGNAQGQLDLLVNSQVYHSVDWQFLPDQLRLNMNVALPMAELDQLLSAELKKSADFKEKSLVWRIKSQKESQDKMSLDNEFRVSTKLNNQRVLVIAEPGGERFIEDPTYHLQLALEAQGVFVKRTDSLQEANQNVSAYELVIALGGGVLSEKEYCPLFSSVENNPTPRHIWLVPYSFEANYPSLCRCLSLLSGQYSSENKLMHCEHVSDQQFWAEFPRSIGGKKVGGSLGQKSGLAWHLHNDSTGVEVTSFNLPLKPSRRSGLQHSNLPVVLRELMAWQGDGSSVAKLTDTWPRLDYYIEKLNKMNSNGSQLLSNVPLGESLGKSLAVDQLPRVIYRDKLKMGTELSVAEGVEDARPWVRFCASATMFFFFMEAFLLFWKWIRSILKMRVEIVFLVLGFGSFMLPDIAWSNISIATLGMQSQTYERLSRDVSHRTSLQVFPKVKQYTQTDMRTLSEPWLWTSNINFITSKKKLKSEVALWVKKGGLLIIQGDFSLIQLSQLTVDFTVAAKWQVIPADHELMRSFYLLKSLSGCQGAAWQGLHMDGRLAIVNIPMEMLVALRDDRTGKACPKSNVSYENSVRSFVNLLMVALATDYKKDQIHLPEILKRLR